MSITLGVSKQYVHRTLKENNLKSNHRIDYIGRLKDVYTERYSVEELIELADFQGTKIAFMRLLKYSEIEFKKPMTGTRKKLDEIETAKAQKSVAIAKALVEREHADNKLKLDRSYQATTPKLH